jgi:NAD(P)-dependent dehydrogenase (short-subunit alcohol dehydrogenase family)
VRGVVQARSLMKDKTVVITGGTSAIGEIAAEALARMGARIVLVARNKSRAEMTLVRLRRSGPRIAHTVYFADLTRLAEMKRVAAEIASREPSIDILINNAGALFGTRRLTEDGPESTFALNHMSYFAVTEVLRERLLASGAARVINTASAAHQGATLDFDDLQSAKSYRAMRAYSFLEAMQHPVYARTRSAPARHRRDRELSTSWFRRDTLRRRKRRFGLALGLARQIFRNIPAEGAQTIIYLASSPEVANVTGKYFNKCRPTTPSASALDDRAALALWERSAALARMKDKGGSDRHAQRF